MFVFFNEDLRTYFKRFMRLTGNQNMRLLVFGEYRSFLFQR